MPSWRDRVTSGKLDPSPRLTRASTLLSPGQAEARAGAAGPSTYGPAGLPSCPDTCPSPAVRFTAAPGQSGPHLPTCPAALITPHLARGFLARFCPP